jgi:hypothetical protein
MSTLPALKGLEETIHSLHQAAQLLGAIRMLVREPQPNYLELALRIEPNGLSSEDLPGGGSVLLDFEQAALVVKWDSVKSSSIQLGGHSQVSLLEALLSTLDAQGQGLAERQEDSFSQGFLSKLHAKMHRLDGSFSLTSHERLEVDPKLSSDYMRVLYRVFAATARFRARLNGYQTPIVVWPEHFDLSTLWIAGEKPDDSGPHMNFGFAPFDSVHARPYLYAYAYPMPEGFEQLPLKAPAQWHTAPWKGIYLPYDELVKAQDPEALIEATFAEVYARLSPALRS